MTPRGSKWSEQQKAHQSQRMTEIANSRSSEAKHLSALRGHATRQILKELKQRQTEKESL